MRKSASGFSILELTVVLLVGLLLSSIFLISFREANATLSATSAEDTVTGKLRMARDMAVSQRKCIVVTFTSPNTITIARQDTLSLSTLLESTLLPPNVLFNNGPGGTPPEGMTGLLNLNGNSVVFFGDGSARDTITASNTKNCVLYIANTDTSNQSALSAVTVMGGTGRARIFHYDSGRGGWF